MSVPSPMPMTGREHESVLDVGPPLRRRLRHRLESTLQMSGAGGVYVRMRRLRGAVVLMYHSVADDEMAAWIDPRNRIAPDIFEAHMRLLAHSRRVISMTDLVEAVQRGETLSAGTVAITFDDGYLDNLTIAAPILAELNLPATLYLPTGTIERAEPQWIDELYGAFRARTGDVLAIEGTGGGGFDLRRQCERQRAYRCIAGKLLTADPRARRALLDEVAAQLRPAGSPPRLTMSWEEVRHLVRRFPQIEIGLHTREHVDLSSCAPEAAELEIRSCARDVERELGVAANHFSFPYGRWDASVAALLRELGLRSAVGCDGECLLRGDVDPFRLPRIEAPASMSRFRFVTSGAYPSLPRILLGAS